MLSEKNSINHDSKSNQKTSSDTRTFGQKLSDSTHEEKMQMLAAELATLFRNRQKQDSTPA